MDFPVSWNPCLKSLVSFLLHSELCNFYYFPRSQGQVVDQSTIAWSHVTDVGVGSNVDLGPGDVVPDP